MKLKRLIITRDKGDDLVYFWPIKAKLVLDDEGIFQSTSAYADIACYDYFYEFKDMFGITLKPGEKKIIEIKEVLQCPKRV